MNRRQFLRNGTLCWSAAAIGTLVRPLSAAAIFSERLCFYVAGVRFYKVATRISPGCELKIGHEIFRGNPAFPIYAPDGAQIGHVPQRHVATIRQWRTPVAYARSVDQFAVPWKRYEVVVFPG
jgi:hypothetical protein